jgi:hypothetical protein
MGLTIHYDWKSKIDPPAAQRMIVKFHALARELPFDDVSEIYEQDPPGGKSAFRRYRHRFREGDIYLSRKRRDGKYEVVHVPALHAVFFNVRVHGAEYASIGLASHPPVVHHLEDVINWNSDGSERERRRGEGDPIEFPTRRRGYYSWQCSCKTQYAGNPKLGGDANFLRAHLSLIELLDQIRAAGVAVRVRDDSAYAKHRNAERLLRSLAEWNAIVAHFVGMIGDALGDRAGSVYAPIWNRPDFEHLEAKGIQVLKRLVARQRRRKK